MPRNRVIYQSEGVFAGQSSPCTGVMYTGANSPKEVYRVQSANYSFNLGKRDVMQFGELAPIDKVPLDPPTVNLDFTYLLANVYNETILGLTTGVNVNFFSGIFSNATNPKNFWVKTVAYGSDLHGAAPSGTTFSVIGFGNCYLSSYTMDAAVADFPRASLRFTAQNIKFDNWTGETVATNTVPSVDANGVMESNYYYMLPSGTSHTSAVDQTTVLRPGDISFTWGAGDRAASANSIGTDYNDLKVQSISMSADIGRTPLNKIGSKFPFSYEINFPVNCSLRITANVGDMSTGSLSRLLDQTGVCDLGISIKKPGTTTVAWGATLKGAQLDSQDFSSSIGDNKTVNLGFSVPLAGANDVVRGIFLSGLA